MPYSFFHVEFPEVAMEETRTIAVEEFVEGGLPVDEYHFVEMYCNERGCDCRRVFFYVKATSDHKTKAVIAYGWEARSFYVKWFHDDDPKMIKELMGPALNFGSPQSKLAPKILELVKEVLLADKEYVERIKEHYAMFREKIDGKRPRKMGNVIEFKSGKRNRTRIKRKRR